MEYIQQGDLLFFRVGDAGVKTEFPETESKVILEGETSGHMHMLAQSTSKLFKFPVDEAGAFAIIDAPQSDIVVHDDHNPVNLRDGTWVVKQVQQVDVPAVIAETRRLEIIEMQKIEMQKIERRNKRAVND